MEQDVRQQLHSSRAAHTDTLRATDAILAFFICISVLFVVYSRGDDAPSLRF